MAINDAALDNSNNREPQIGPYLDHFALLRDAKSSGLPPDIRDNRLITHLAFPKTVVDILDPNVDLKSLSTRTYPETFVGVNPQTNKIYLKVNSKTRTPNENEVTYVVRQRDVRFPTWEAVLPAGIQSSDITPTSDPVKMVRRRREIVQKILTSGPLEQRQVNGGFVHFYPELISRS